MVDGHDSEDDQAREEVVALVVEQVVDDSIEPALFVVEVGKLKEMELTHCSSLLTMTKHKPGIATWTG